MKDNTILLMTTEIVCGLICSVAMIMGNNEVAIIAATAAGSLLAGHLNGRQAA